MYNMQYRFLRQKCSEVAHPRLSFCRPGQHLTAFLPNETVTIFNLGIFDASHRGSQYERFKSCCDRGQRRLQHAASELRL